MSRAPAEALEPERALQSGEPDGRRIAYVTCQLVPGEKRSSRIRPAVMV
jgi:hypothetical protein